MPGKRRATREIGGSVYGRPKTASSPIFALILQISLSALPAFPVQARHPLGGPHLKPARAIRPLRGAMFWAIVRVAYRTTLAKHQLFRAPRH